MSTKTAAEAEETTAEPQVETASEDPMLDSLAAAVKKIVAKAKQRGYVNEAEMNEALPGDQFTSDQIEDALARLAELGINIVDTDEQEEAEQAKQADGADSAEAEDEEVEERKAGNVDENDIGRTDDPVRMYLREMGSVELLSRSCRARARSRSPSASRPAARR